MTPPTSSPRCPLCLTAGPVSLATGDRTASAWRCTTCGHYWDDVRLRTVAAYVAWNLERAKETHTRGR